MAYSTIPKGSLFMNTVLYTGNGAASNAITGVGFQPDFTWIKNRTNAQRHVWTDAVRGTSYQLASDSPNEQTNYTNSLTAFGSDGFTVGTDNGTNMTSQTLVAWNWKANGQGSSNTDGSINTTYTSVNTTTKFSISRYTGTGSNATVGHGLGVVPTMLFIKRITGGGSGQLWTVYTSSVGEESRLVLNTNSSSEGGGSYFNNTNPTSSVFSIGTSSTVNTSGDDYICYAYANVKGYSKMASYVGNGNAEGTFTYTGFTPSWIMVKCSSNGSRSWSIFDNKRSPFNISQNTLLADTTGVEITNGNNGSLDILSNGFKMRNTDAGTNGSGLTYIYMAFASNPFVATSGSDAIPVTAR